MNDLAVAIVHTFATLYMVGLIWFVQISHYPLFAQVGPEGFVEYARAHQRRTTWVVGPPMLAEVATALYFVISDRPPLPGWVPWLGLALLVGIWLATALLSVPCHGRLVERRDASVIHRLVQTNWIRTVLWSARGALALWMLVSIARAS